MQKSNYTRKQKQLKKLKARHKRSLRNAIISYALARKNNPELPELTEEDLIEGSQKAIDATCQIMTIALDSFKRKLEESVNG